MTPSQIFSVAAIGGLAALIGLIAFVALAVACYHAVTRIHDQYEARQERRRHLKTCRAIDELGTTAHPTDQ
ncbi:hypothetical protein AB0D27_11210 [Streptomyces sp. NPDC048415]|uniref:hypothetical protein n=1 Tax=Streptomyces sp. NPDC048415 TaxID=3154822 RepID=UPI003438968B